MFYISYGAMVLGITGLWLLVRAWVWKQQGNVSLKRELMLSLVYICFIVVARYTFFPFATVNGKVQPLVFDAARMLPPRINLVPFVNLLDYPEPKEILLNVVGNTTMFIPIGVIWPLVYKKLDTHGKVIAAGVGLSLAIEVLQMPFFDRVTDIDDLLLNSIGFLVGYGLYSLVKQLTNGKKKSSV